MSRYVEQETEVRLAEPLLAGANPDPHPRNLLTRRQVLSAAMALAASGCAATGSTRSEKFSQQLEEVHAHVGGRIGVQVLDTRSGHELAFNANDRFAMCSTFKILLAAGVLSWVESGALSLEQEVGFGKDDMLPHAPVTSANLARGLMSVRELCEAAVVTSDNPAANMLLGLIGGPRGLTQYLRSIGDFVTRLDRTEPELNSNQPGDLRDTTTPYAMTQTMRKLLLPKPTEKALSQTSRSMLIDWLRNSQTGLQRLRANLPRSWAAGDKTGTGTNGATNDVMIAWPPGRSAVIAAVYMSESSQPLKVLEQAHADIGWFIVGTM